MRRAPAFERVPLALAGRQLRRHIRERHDRDCLRLNHAARTAIKIGDQAQRARLGQLLSVRRECGQRRRRGALPSRENKPQKRMRAALRRFKMVAVEQRRVRRLPGFRQKTPIKPRPSAGNPFVQRSRHRFHPFRKKPLSSPAKRAFLLPFFPCPVTSPRRRPARPAGTAPGSCPRTA